MTLIPRIETPEFKFFFSIRRAACGTLTVTRALLPALICSGKLTVAAVLLPRTFTVAWALVTWQLLPFESLLGQLTLSAAKLFVPERLTGLPEFSLLIRVVLCVTWALTLAPAVVYGQGAAPVQGEVRAGVPTVRPRSEAGDIYVQPPAPGRPPAFTRSDVRERIEAVAKARTDAHWGET